MSAAGIRRAAVWGILLAGTLAGYVHAQMPKGLEGAWKLNVAKSKFSPVPADGPAQTWEMSPKFDGKDYPVKGHPNADTIALGKADGMKSESTFKKGGKVTAMNARTLSADGKTLTIEMKGTDEQGRAVHNIQVFER